MEGRARIRGKWGGGGRGAPTCFKRFIRFSVLELKRGFVTRGEVAAGQGGIPVCACCGVTRHCTGVSHLL